MQEYEEREKILKLQKTEIFSESSSKNLLYTFNDRKVSREDFSVIKLLGKGAYGKVLLVEEKNTKKKFAMKVLQKKFLIKK